MVKLSSEERLYRIALANVERTWGSAALSQLGFSIRRALILAEVLYLIGSQDDEDNRMTKLAIHAITRANGNDDGEART